jgi:hypothetical protein
VGSVSEETGRGRSRNCLCTISPDTNGRRRDITISPGAAKSVVVDLNRTAILKQSLEVKS